MPKILLPGSYKFQSFFFFSIVALDDVNDRGLGTPHIGITP